MKLGDIVNTKGGWKGRITNILDECDGIKYSSPIAEVEQIEGTRYIVVVKRNLKFNDVSKEYDQVSW